jgi:hypothetical protein
MFEKNILKVGKYQSPDGELNITPERIKHFASEFSRMKKAGLAVPMAWSHPDALADSLPVVAPKDRRRPPQDTAGYLTGFTPAKDGQSVDICVDVPRKTDAEKVKANLAFVSPVILDTFKDGQGEDYIDCITHVDLVQYPVDSKQGKFSPVATACALRMCLAADAKTSQKPSYYRMAHEDDKMGKDRTGNLSVDDGNKPIVTDDSDKSENNKTDNNDDSTSDNPGESNENNNDVTSDLQDGTGEAVSDDAGRLRSVIEALAALKVMLPEDTNTVNLLPRLEAALLTSAAITGEGDMGIQTGTAGLETESPVLAAMSLQARSAHAYASNQHREAISKRLSLLLEIGRCTPHEAKERGEMVKAVRLSLDDKGRPAVGDLEKWIECREACPAGTHWDPEMRTRMSTLEVGNPPAGLTGPLSDEEAEELADEVCGKPKATAGTK